MKPLIKWPGGKSREFKNIENIIPNDIDKYIEPFFGGGGIYFNLEPNKAIINDVNESLMSLYSFFQTQDTEFKSIITQIANDWDNLSIIAKKVYKKTNKYKNNINNKDIAKEILELSKDKNLPQLINGQEHFWDLLKKGLVDKLKRIVDLEIKKGKFKKQDFYNQTVAVTKGSYYYYIRDKYTPINKKEEVAQFFFLREYCFGSMFRFNKNGKFNIPYGGASYNNKLFHAKINKSYSGEINKLLKNTDIYCEDFRSFFRRIESTLNWNDFCFFDPPYDTEFSEYDKQSFGKKDQADLAKIFGNLKCKGLMIIKKTNFINDIYQMEQKKNSKIQIDQYEKKYSYNVRGRNSRGVTHLLITNYDFDPKRSNI